MEKRNRNRLAFNVFCRIAPSTKKRNTAWKRIENISAAGMLVEWSRPDADIPSPRVGDSFAVEVELPAHDIFGQRALEFRAKVVRVFRDSGGRVMAGLETTRCRFRSLRAGSWAKTAVAETVH